MPVDVRYADFPNARWVSQSTGSTFPWVTAIPPRDSLVTGTYEPAWDADPMVRTVGVLGDEADLTEYNSDTVNSVTIPAGAVISDKIIYGDVTFAGAAELHNCLLVGGANTLPSGNLGVIRCVNSRAGIAKLYDCTLRPRQESNGRDCALGWQYELYRCHLSGGIDGAGIYHNVAPYNNAAVKVHACLIEDLTYVYPDNITTSHTDGTHNDCIQIQGGRNIDIFGNALVGTSHKAAGTGSYASTEWLFTDAAGPWINGSGIIIQKNIGAAPAFDSTVQIRGNYFRACKQQLTIKSTATGGFQCYDNQFSAVDHPSLNSAPPPTQNPYWIRFDNLGAIGTIPGLTSSGSLSNTTNVWLDGASVGTALTSPRASGVHTDV
jgi:hypothetical protein